MVLNDHVKHESSGILWGNGQTCDSCSVPTFPKGLKAFSCPVFFFMSVELKSSYFGKILSKRHSFLFFKYLL